MRITVLLAAALAIASCRGAGAPAAPKVDPKEIHRALFEEIQPVKLSNCEFERIGDPNDGGYVMCKNLLADARSLYSYGISGTDQWGCTLSERLQLPVHQYDCFNLDRPACASARPMFHEECIGPRKETIEDRLFDTMEAQIARNGDAGKRVIVKMDVEGSEWASFTSMPEDVLRNVDQLMVEFHDVNQQSYVDVIRKLKAMFHVVNVHYNNWTCHQDVTPLPSLVFEVLFVNKNIGIVDPAGKAVVPNPLDAPNNNQRPDCQTAAATAAIFQR